MSFLLLCLVIALIIYLGYLACTKYLGTPNSAGISAGMPLFSGKCQQILALLREAALLIGSDGKIEFLNKAAQDLLGRTEDEAVGRHYNEVYFREGNLNGFDPIADILRGLQGEKSKKLTLATKDGKLLPIQARLFPIFNSAGEIANVLCFLSDLSKQEIPQVKLAELTFKDALTGLYNRAFFEKELPRLDRPEYLPLSILVGDLDGLKLTNDIFGHQAGDELLKTAASVFQEVCRPHDRIFRWGGDEFVVLMPNTSKEDALEVKEAFLAKVAYRSIGPIMLHVALGCATKEVVDQDIQALWQFADEEMFWMKTISSSLYQRQTLENIAKELFARSQAERAHGERVSVLAEKFGAFLGLPEAELRKLRVAGKFHDIGKVALEPELLHKPYPLSARDQQQMQRHPLVGFRLLNFFEDTVELAEGVLAHHERWDGKGYPKGLSCREIPLLGRILAIIETYDRVLYDPHAFAVTPSRALETIAEGSGKEFDPALVDSFLKMMKGTDLAYVGSNQAENEKKP